MPREKSSLNPFFSPREGEVMGVLFEKKRANARDIWRALGETRTYSTIRKQLSILEEKGYVTHVTEGQTFVYSAAVCRENARVSALGRIIDTFFQGSAEGLVSSLLGDSGKNLSSGELDRISKLIERAKKEKK